MKGFLAKKSIFLKLMTVTLSASILGSWGIFYWLTGNIGDVNLSLEGLNTCFSRVSQNYSGKMIGANQPYTKSSFYHMTEECFSDLESVIKKSFFHWRGSRPPRTPHGCGPVGKFDFADHNR